MADSERVRGLLDRLLVPRIGHTCGNWPRRVRELVERLAQAKQTNPVDFLTDLLERLPGAPLDALVDSATIGHTAFFRHPEQFEELARVLPQLYARQKRRLRLWCAGCSTGEEAYSLALAAERARVAVEILATDVNPLAVQFARVGRYSGLQPGQLPGHTKTSDWVAHDSLRRAIRFEVASIADVEPALDFGRVDLISCRNVLIYFERAEVPALLEGLAAKLLPDGALVVSPADAVLPIPPALLRGNAPGWLTRARATAGADPVSVRPQQPARGPVSHGRGSGSGRPPERSASHIDRAAQLLGSGRGHDAEIALTALLNREPGSVAGWFLLGEALAQRGEMAQARAAFERVARCTAGDTDGVDAETLRWAAIRRAAAL